MKNINITFIICCLAFTIQSVNATQNNDSIVLINYQKAYNEINAMLENENALSFEDAVFSMENAYYENQLSKEEYTKTLDFYTSRIIELAYANKDRIPAQVNNSIRTLSSSENTGVGSVLLNWAIYTYITDTTYWKQNGVYEPNYPMVYQNTDPFGKENWETTQITSLLKTNRGNCFSLAALYYIFSQRLQSEAYLATAPQHIYIQHKGFDENFYNVELTTHTFPGSGTIKAYTYTSHAAVTNGIALRRLNEKQAVALCLVQLAKGYERKLRIKNEELRIEGDEFRMQCAYLALQHDALSLNAMLLKAQVLEKETLKEKQKNTKTFHELESTVLALNKLGYIQMPKEMQEALLVNAQGANFPIRVYSEYLSKERGAGGEVFPSINKTLQYYTLSENKFPEIQPINNHFTIGNTCFTITEQKIDNISTYQLAYKNSIDPVTFALAIDPLAEKFPFISPYNSMGNNPINRIDPTGMADEAAGNFDPLHEASLAPLSDNTVSKIINTRDIGESVFTMARGSKEQNKKFIISKTSLTLALASTSNSDLTKFTDLVAPNELDKLQNAKVEGSSLTLNMVKSADVMQIPLMYKKTTLGQLQLADDASVDFSNLSYQYVPVGACDGYTGLRDANGAIYLKGVSVKVTFLTFPIKKINVATTTDTEGNNVTSYSLPGIPKNITDALIKPITQNKYKCTAK